MRLKKINLILILSLLAGSCTMHPRYERDVEVAVPDQWRISSDEMNAFGNVNWWKELGDPVLDGYIQEALRNNQDLKVAIHTVEEFVAQLGIARSQFYPQISGGASYERQKVSTNVLPLTPGTPLISNFYELVLNGSYEVDIWGKILSAVEAAKANLLAEIQNQRTVVLTLVSAVATTYITLRQYDMQLAIAQDTKKTFDESYRLAVIRFELGLTSLLEVEQAKSEVEEAQTTVDQLRIQVATQEDLLCFLLGKAPGNVERGKLLGDIIMPPQIPAYLPSELLNQRPDILSAEQTLISANAQIGVAKANFFPQISLTGVYGYASLSLSNLLQKASSLWQWGVNLLQEIFTGFDLTYQLRLTEAQKLAAVHQYQSTILNAFKEVNDALISHKIGLELVQEQKKRVETLSEYYHLSVLRYENGQTDYLTLLDSERHLFQAQLDYAQALGYSFTTLISVFKSLGGGWVVEADNMVNVEYLQNPEKAD